MSYLYNIYIYARAGTGRANIKQDRTKNKVSASPRKNGGEALTERRKRVRYEYSTELGFFDVA